MQAKTMIRAVIGAGALVFCVGSALAQEAGAPLTPPNVVANQQRELAHGDPHRWFNDDKTLQARLQTLRKEIGAAYAEAKIGCQKGEAANRSACMAEARQTYNHDMANARETAMASR
ncbi:hypothetical protein [Zemynaea arenosa]|nr:hypothetical protein [Massilia arenosa]